MVNGDDPELLAAVQEYPGKRITFGFKETNDLFASDIHCDDTGTHFSLNNSRREVFVPMLGRHSACNALAAIAVGRKMGLNEDDIIESLGVARGPEMRLQWQPAGSVRLLNDAYNAGHEALTAKNYPGAIEQLEKATGLDANQRHTSVRRRRVFGQVEPAPSRMTKTSWSAVSRTA